MNSDLSHSVGRRILEKTVETPEAVDLLVSGGPCSRLTVKSTEETLAELRRENFRLRLKCFDYEKARKRITDPQDADSSRLFSVEAENLSLKEVISEKDRLLRSASKMIDTLKEENDSFREQLSEAMKKLAENEEMWRGKYDSLYSELQEARQAIRLSDLRALSVEMDSNRQGNEFQGRISELEACLETYKDELESKRREMELVRSEATQWRAALKQLNHADVHLDVSQTALQDVSNKLHVYCQELKEKDRTIERLNLILSVLNGAADVTQYTINQGDSADVSVATDAANDRVTAASTSRLPDVNDDENSSLMLQMLSLSTKVVVSQTSDMPQSPEVNRSSSRKRFETFTVDVPSQDRIEKTPVVEPAAASVIQVQKLESELNHVRMQLSKQMSDYARLKKDYDVLLASANIGSFASEVITSLDVTKDVRYSPDSPSALGSLADLPTVSTPPKPLKSRDDLDDVTNVDHLMEDNNLPVTCANLSSPEMSYTTLDAEEVPLANGKVRHKSKGCRSMIISSKHADFTELSTSGILNPINIHPVLDMSLPGILEFPSTDRIPHNTPVHGGSESSHVVPTSVARLRDLYNLVHGLKVQLDNVRFTQQSFVEMVNRSLGTSGLDVSLLFTPSKTNTSKPTGLPDKEINLPDVSRADLPYSSDNSATKQLSTAATHGGTETLLDNLMEADRFVPEMSFESEPGINQTLSELRVYPSSPSSDMKTGQDKPRSFIPVPEIGKMTSKVPFARAEAASHLVSTSFTDGMPHTRTPTIAHSHTPLSHSFAGDAPSSPTGARGPKLGDVTMVELQNQDLFERLARATAKLREVLDECAEVGSLLWNGDLSQSLISELGFNPQSNQPVEIDPVNNIPEGVLPDGSSAKQSLTNAPATNRSVRFDRIDPHLAPSDFAQLSADSDSLSQMWFEKAAHEVHGSAQTSVSMSKPMHSSETVTDSSSSVLMLRFVSLITHALTVVHRAVMDKSTDTWLVSWTQSATHWYQSYMDAFTGYERSISDSVPQQMPANEDLYSLLECLERVFNQHIDNWVSETTRRFGGHTPTIECEEPLKACASPVLDETNKQSDQLPSVNDPSEPQAENLCQLDPVSGNLNAGADDSVVSLPSTALNEQSKSSIFCRVLGVTRLSQSAVSEKNTVSPSKCLQTESSQLGAILDLIRSAGFPVVSEYSLKDCIESLLTDWRLAKDDRESLLVQLKNTTPLEDHRKVQEELASVKCTLDTYLNEIETQRCYIRERLRLVELDVQFDDIVDCVDHLLAELFKARNCLSQIEEENTKLLTQLESSVPKLELEQKKQQLDILASDLQEMKCHHKAVEHVVTVLSPMAASTVERSATALVDWISAEFVEQCGNVNRLLSQQHDTIHFLSEFTGVEETGVSLTDLLEYVKQTFTDSQEDADRLKMEREEMMTMFREFGLEDQGDIVCQLEVLLSTLVEKQQALLELEEACANVREQLCQSVPISDHDNLQSELSAVREELTSASTKICELEAELDSIRQSSIPLKDHEHMISELTNRLIDQQVQSEEQIGRIQSALIDDVVGQTTEDLAVRVKQVVQALREHKESVDRFQKQLVSSSEDCEQWKQRYSSVVVELNNLVATNQEHVHTVRFELEQKIDDLQIKIRLCETELDKQRLANEQLENMLEAKESELNRLSDELRDSQLDIAALRSTVVAKAENVKAAMMTAKAHEERANELATALDALRREHAQRSPQGPSLVSAQTSPVGKSKSAEQLLTDPVVASQLNSEDMDNHKQLGARVRKYGELKAVAFEIKEKLIRRTDKLEAALTEVARLRSVIQQDKEHASRVLEEVESLRKQAIRKNRKIRDLEIELARLKSLANGAVVTDDQRVVSEVRNTHSSARTVSDLEQPRGSHCRLLISPTIQNLNASLCASLINDPSTSVHYSEFERDVASQRNSSTLLLHEESLAPQQTPERDISSVTPIHSNDASITPCKHCDELQTVVASLQNLSAELQRRVDFDLHEEYSLMATLERQSLSDSPAESVAEGEHTMDRHLRNASNVTRESAMSRTSARSSLCSGMSDLKLNILSLHRARSRLKHYAAEMDRICSTVVQRIRTADEKSCVTACVELQQSLSHSLHELGRVYKRLKALINEVEEPHRSSTKRLARDIKHVIRVLSQFDDQGNWKDGSLTPHTLAEDKENVTPLVSLTDSVEIHNRAKQRELAKRAERYRRRYEQLAHGLDVMTKELSETTGVLSAARTNLERSTGLSAFARNSISP